MGVVQYLAMGLTSYLGEGRVTNWKFGCDVGHKEHFAHTLNIDRLSKIVCLASAQVIELPVKHPELFEALGIDQPKVRFD